MRKRLSILAVMAGLLLAPAPASAVVSGNLEALFTSPTVGGIADATVHAKVTSLIDAAASGSTLRVALGTDTDQSIVDRLLAAQNERSVTVLAVAEQCPSGSGATCAAPSARLTALAGGLAAGRFTWCGEGCLSASGVLARNSFLVLDGLTDGRTDVVVQASGDLSATARVQRNNLLISVSDTALAAAYRNYFGQLVAQTATAFSGSVVGAKTEVFFHPRAGTEDILANAINDVQCPGGTIRVAAAALSAARTAVVNALIARRAAGCSVGIVMPDRQDGLTALGAGALSVVTYRPGGCRMPVSGSCATGGLGSSYILVEGVSTKAGVTKKYVWTGSARLTAVKDDATIVKIDDATIYAGYLADYTAAINNAIVLQPNQWPYAESTYGNGNSAGDQDYAQVAAGRNGHLAVVWEDDRSGTDPEENYHSEVYIRMFQNGVSKYEKKVSLGGDGNWRHVRPDVAVDNAGNAVVTWLHDGDGNGLYNIYASYLNAAGTITGTTRVNANADGQQMYPAVAMDPDAGAGGGFVVVWEDRRLTPSHIRAAGFASITSKRYEVQVSATTQTAGANALPDVGLDAAANAYIVWQEDRDGNDYYNIALRVLTPGGANKVSQKAANVDGHLQQVDPSIAVNHQGDFVVSWRGDQTGALRAYFRTFNSATTALMATERRSIDDAEATGDPLGTQTEPRVGIDDQSNVVIAWLEAGYAGYEPWARGFNRTGNPAGKFPPARMSVHTTNKQADLSLAVHPYGEFSVGYTDDRDGNGYDQIQLRNFFSNSLW